MALETQFLWLLLEKSSLEHQYPYLSLCICRANILPFRSVVPEIVVCSFKDHPVKVIQAVLETSQVGRRSCWYPINIHCPVTSTREIFISRTGYFALIISGVILRTFIHTNASQTILKASVFKSHVITRGYASKILYWLEK